jgi:uncharacterized protein (TIGR03435 family)
MALLVLSIGAVCLAASPQFDAASIKPNPSAPLPGRMGAHIDTSPGRLIARGESLKELAVDAYGIEDYQVTGGPDWIASARFDVEAKPSGAATREQLLSMLQTLLADRFQLAFHRETRQLAVYTLVVSKGAPKFKPGTDTPSVDLLGHNWNLPHLAQYLTHFGSDRPVIDKTGLTGSFNLDLNMAKIGMAASEAPGGASSNANVYQATVNAMEDMGLRLMPAKVPVEVLVIDRAEKPGAN